LLVILGNRIVDLPPFPVVEFSVNLFARTVVRKDPDPAIQGTIPKNHGGNTDDGVSEVKIEHNR